MMKLKFKDLKIGIHTYESPYRRGDLIWDKYIFIQHHGSEAILARAGMSWSVKDSDQVIYVLDIDDLPKDIKEMVNSPDKEIRLLTYQILFNEYKKYFKRVG